LKIILLVFLLISTVYSSDKELATKIYLSIAQEFSGKESPVFYLYKDIKYLDKNANIKITKDCKSADIVVINTLKSLSPECSKKVIFTTKYRLYSENENIIGAFFWQKGRPTVIFNRELLKQHNIVLSKSFQKYIE